MVPRPSWAIVSGSACGVVDIYESEDIGVCRVR